MPRALITGATGFIGSRLTQALTCRGWATHAIIRPTSDLDRVAKWLGGAVLHPCELSFQSVRDAAREAAPDIVFHLATLFKAEHKPNEVGDLVKSNVEFGAYVLESLKETPNVPFVNIGTSWQYFHSNTYLPACLYAATKQAFMDVMQYYVSAVGQKAMTLTLLDTYGPFDHRMKLFYQLRLASLGAEPLSMSPGEQKLDLVYISDVVEAFLLLADRILRGQELCCGETYRVTSGRSYSLKEIVAIYEKASGRKVPVNWGARSYRPREIMSPWEGGRILPGWSARVGLLEGIALMEWIESGDAKTAR
ncbi:MAG: NAD(P)-dependent oxidoreductase [bacterium]